MMYGETLSYIRIVHDFYFKLLYALTLTHSVEGQVN